MLILPPFQKQGHGGLWQLNTVLNNQCFVKCVANVVVKLHSFCIPPAQLLLTVDKFYVQDPQVLDITGKHGTYPVELASMFRFDS